MSFWCCNCSRGLTLEPTTSATSPVSIQLEPSSNPVFYNQDANTGATRRPFGFPCILQSSSCTSLNRHPPPSRLNHLIDGNSDSDDDQISSKRLKEALKLVQKRLLRLKPNGPNARNQSRVSIGNTEEEIARRAELKRLMHQRIQNELFIEQTDDKPKPNSSLSPLASGPRDYIEFSVTAPPANDPSKCAELGAPSTIPLPHYESKGLTQREDTSLEPSLVYKSPEGSVKEATGTVHCLYPELVSAQLVPASRCGSIPQSLASQRSFQLSNANSRLDRILGPDNGFSSRRGSSSVDGHSGLGIWLATQGLRPKDDLIVSLKDSDQTGSLLEENFKIQVKDDTASQASNLSVIQGAPSVTKCEPRQPYDEIDASKWLIQRSTPEQVATPKSRSFRDSLDLTQRAVLEETEDMLDSVALAGILNGVADSTSSNYNSKLPSFQPSPCRSQPHIHGIDSRDLQSLQLSPFRAATNQSSFCEFPNTQNPGPISYTHSDECIINASDITTEGYPTFGAPGTVSLSETASFQQREIELLSIQTRFSDVLSCWKPSVPVKSRFREELSRRGRGKTRQDFMNKLHLNIPKRLKSRPRLTGEIGSSVDITGCKRRKPSHLTIRASLHSPSSYVEAGPSLGQDNATVNMWQQAIKRESEERRSSQTGTSTYNVNNEDISVPTRAFNLRVGPRREKSSSNTVLATGHSDRQQEQPSQVVSESDELRKTENSKKLLQRWVVEMLPGTLRHDGNIKRSTTVRYKKPPNSWTMYPSHTREQRTKYASTKDDIRPRDFAIQEIAPDGRVFWSTDMEVPQQSVYERPLTRSLSMRFGQAVKSKLTNFLPASKGKDETAVVLWKRRSVSQGAKELEYPELEILPTESGFKELEALEWEIDNIRGKTCSQISQHDHDQPVPKRSLGSKISSRMQSAPTPECEEHNRDPKIARDSKAPSTPTSHSLAQESIVLTDTFVTPQSRLSSGRSPSLRTQQSEPKSEGVSSRNEQLVIQRLSNDESLATIRP
ncbi:hypothetical protein BGZ63DRAFT_94080 [Mariannaea sp. PMI_226]|nr:hypothetical protein BGZ63DRAFT_94080 [Mariannaea sp. PMI_226]